MASVGRSLKIMFVSMVLSLLCSMAVYAGQWRLDHVGWWYENDDGIGLIHCVIILTNRGIVYLIQ